MKKKIVLFIIILGSIGSILGIALCIEKDKVTQDTTTLPAESRLFLSDHYPEAAVSHIKIEKNLLGTKGYDVILTNGVNVEFNRAGKWKEVEGHRTVIPEALVPPAIIMYVRNNFADKEIVSIEKERRDCKIKLNNGLELLFDRNENLIEIDD